MIVDPDDTQHANCAHYPKALSDRPEIEDSIVISYDLRATMAPTVAFIITTMNLSFLLIYGYPITPRNLPPLLAFPRDQI